MTSIAADFYSCMQKQRKPFPILELSSSTEQMMQIKSNVVMISVQNNDLKCVFGLTNESVMHGFA